jgi:hypothetical protein
VAVVARLAAERPPEHILQYKTKSSDTETEEDLEEDGMHI